MEEPDVQGLGVAVHRDPRLNELGCVAVHRDPRLNELGWRLLAPSSTMLSMVHRLF